MLRIDATDTLRGRDRLAKEQRLRELRASGQGRQRGKWQGATEAGCSKAGIFSTSEVPPSHSAPIWASCLDWENLGSPTTPQGSLVMARASKSQG